MEDFRSGYVLDITDKDRQTALEKFGECPELVDGNLTSLGCWLQEQTHLKSRQDDEFLLMFLREAQFSQKLARELLEKYIRSRCSDPHKELHLKGPKLDQAVSEIIIAAGIFVLPTLPESGRRTMFCIHKNIDGKKHSFSDVLRAAIVSTEIAMLDQVTQINGHQNVVDGRDVTLDQVRTVRPAITRAGAKCFFVDTPLKKDEMHFFNCTLVHRGVIRIWKLFMDKKTSRCIFDHGSDVAKLQEQLQPEVLPEEYGGKAGPCLELARRWHQHVCSNVHRLAAFDVVTW